MRSNISLVYFFEMYRFAVRFNKPPSNAAVISDSYINVFSTLHMVNSNVTVSKRKLLCRSFYNFSYLLYLSLHPFQVHAHMVPFASNRNRLLPRAAIILVFDYSVIIVLAMDGRVY